MKYLTPMIIRSLVSDVNIFYKTLSIILLQKNEAAEEGGRFIVLHLTLCVRGK